jgi:hypothetical protein
VLRPLDELIATVAPSGISRAASSALIVWANDNRTSLQQVRPPIMARIGAAGDPAVVRPAGAAAAGLTSSVRLKARPEVAAAAKIAPDGRTRSAGRYGRLAGEQPWKALSSVSAKPRCSLMVGVV